jgi:hypothetical protein
MLVDYPFPLQQCARGRRTFAALLRRQCARSLLLGVAVPANVVLQHAQALDAVLDPAQFSAQQRGANPRTGHPLRSPVGQLQLTGQPLLDAQCEPDVLLPDQPVKLTGDQR